jgi:polysaccharide chain length determinant protein (PEP-CTERM system associated)
MATDVSVHQREIDQASEAQAEGSLKDTIDWGLNFIRRRTWWILVPACVGALASAVALLNLPKRYSSVAMLVVVQPQIAPQYLPLQSIVPPSEIIQNIAREVLSRPRLLRIIDELGLYAGEKRTDGLAERMRKDVNVEPVGGRGARDFSAFEISFTAESPHLAQSVNGRLASLFIEENLRRRGDQAERATSFLADQLDEARRRLAEQEERLKDFKMRNLGELPEEQAVNVATLTDLRSRLQRTQDQLGRAKQQQTNLTLLLSSHLSRLTSERSALLSRVTPQHPDVAKKDQEIAKLRALLERLQSGTLDSNQPLLTAPIEDIGLAQLIAQAETNAHEIKTLYQDELRLNAEISQYQKRLNLTPVREQQLSAILRDYEQYKRDYSDLLNKQLQAQLAASLEHQHGGQHFRLVEPPTLPPAPSSPDAKKVLFGGLAAGLALGVALAFLVHTVDQSFHTEKEVSQRYAVPLVVGVPLLLTSGEQRLLRLKRFGGWLLAGVMIAVAVGAQFYAYRFA